MISCVHYDQGCAEGKDTLLLCVCAPRITSNVNLTSNLGLSRDVIRGPTSTEALGLLSRGTTTENWLVQLGVKESVEEVTKEVFATQEQLDYDDNSFHEVCRQVV